MENNIKDKIKQFFVDECGVEATITDSDQLFSSGLVSSINMVQLLVFLEGEFDIKVSPLETSLDNFDTIQTLESFVAQKQTS
ncbi:MAG: acyl carrier protein [Bdellovibrionota bacterium]